MQSHFSRKVYLFRNATINNVSEEFDMKCKICKKNVVGESVYCQKCENIMSSHFTKEEKISYSDICKSHRHSIMFSIIFTFMTYAMSFENFSFDFSVNLLQILAIPLVPFYCYFCSRIYWFVIVGLYRWYEEHPNMQMGFSIISYFFAIIFFLPLIFIYLITMGLRKEAVSPFEFIVLYVSPIVFILFVSPWFAIGGIYWWYKAHRTVKHIKKSASFVSSKL